MKKRKEPESSELPVEIQEMLKGVPPTEEVLSRLEKQKVDFDKDPEFVADLLKAEFVEEIYVAMEEMGINKNQLAEILGKSRQYVGRVLNETANFTIETMAEISCALGKNLEIRVINKQQRIEIKPRLEMLASKTKQIDKLKDTEFKEEVPPMKGAEVRDAKDLAA